MFCVCQIVLKCSVWNSTLPNRQTNSAWSPLRLSTSSAKPMRVRRAFSCLLQTQISLEMVKQVTNMISFCTSALALVIFLPVSVLVLQRQYLYDYSCVPTICLHMPILHPLPQEFINLFGLCCMTFLYLLYFLPHVPSSVHRFPGCYQGIRLSDGQKGWFPADNVIEITNEHVRRRNIRERYRVLQAASTFANSKSRTLS